MSLLDRLERVFGRFAVPNLSLYLVIGQVFVLLARMLHLLDGEKLYLQPDLVLAGDWWRVLTFLFLQPINPSFFGSTTLGFVMLVFGWYLFYLMGGALEEYWGTFRYNVYLLLTVLLTVGLAFLTPGEPVTNRFILLSVFLAFAYLNPDFELVLFFVLPLKIKWIALLTWALYAVYLALGTWGLRLQVAASVVAFALFFGGSMLHGAKRGRRVAAQRSVRVREEAQPRHVCHVCGKTDLTHPQLDFRYCSKCAGDQCYCPEHIHNHAHVVSPESQA